MECRHAEPGPALNCVEWAPDQQRIVIAPRPGHEDGAPSQNISIPLTPWQPSWATNGRPLTSLGTVHALPRTAQSSKRVVVDGRPASIGGDPCADFGRRHPVAGGKPASGK